MQPDQKPNNYDYAVQAIDYLQGDSGYQGALRVYQAALNDPHVDDWVLGQIGLHDRYFFLSMILNVSVMFEQVHPEWLYERCREVEAQPDGMLDLWAREHWKSSIITFAGVIQECAKDSGIYPDLEPEDAFFRGPSQEITVGIFSHNTKIARGSFVNRIRRELQQNKTLPKLYPDVFWSDPRRESPSWSRDDGLILKRTSNPAEPTISGWGLVDAQPTSMHFKLMVYDDVVTEKSVTPDMIAKTTEAWELSRSLSGKIPGIDGRRTWYIGTRYNYADTYRTILKRKVADPRLHAATDDGTPDGTPIFLSESDWIEKKKENSTYILACQYLQNPIAGKDTEFQLEWLRRYEIRPETLNIAILVDPASSKKKGTSNTAMAVLGIDAARNKYLLDGACHKMSLNERWLMLKGLRGKWVNQKGIQSIKVGYERYGHQTDIEHFKEMMKIEKKSFPIEEVSWPRDHTDAKDDRIRRLVPDHQNWRFFYPYEGQETSQQREAGRKGRGYLVAKPIKRVNELGRVYNLVKYLINNEYLFFPATTAKDLLDAMSRVYDLQFNPPRNVNEQDMIPLHSGED